jgi:hypothetical protein
LEVAIQSVSRIVDSLGARSRSFEESVGSVVEVFVERVSEAGKIIGRLHDAPIMHSQRDFPHSLSASGVRTQAKRSSGTDLSMPDSGYQAGCGEHRPCGGGSNDDPGQHVEGEMDAEVDAGEDDEDSCQHERWGKRRVHNGEC